MGSEMCIRDRPRTFVEFRLAILHEACPRAAFIIWFRLFVFFPNFLVPTISLASNVRRVWFNHTIRRLPPYLAWAPRYCPSFSWYCPFLLAFDEKAQWPPRVRDCCLCVPPPRMDDSFLSSAVCLKSGTPIMVIYTSSQRLPRFNSVAEFFSWFSSICAFTISRVPRANSVPTLCSDHLLFFYFSRVHVRHDLPIISD